MTERISNPERIDGWDNHNHKPSQGAIDVNYVKKWENALHSFDVRATMQQIEILLYNRNRIARHLAQPVPMSVQKDLMAEYDQTISKIIQILGIYV